jgi:hypothetical protein
MTTDTKTPDPKRAQLEADVAAAEAERKAVDDRLNAARGRLDLLAAIESGNLNSLRLARVVVVGGDSVWLASFSSLSAEGPTPPAAVAALFQLLDDVPEAEAGPAKK